MSEAVYTAVGRACNNWQLAFENSAGASVSVIGEVDKRRALGREHCLDGVPPLQAHIDLPRPRHAGRLRNHHE